MGWDGRALTSGAVGCYRRYGVRPLEIREPAPRRGRRPARLDRRYVTPHARRGAPHTGLSLTPPPPHAHAPSLVNATRDSRRSRQGRDGGVLRAAPTRGAAPPGVRAAANRVARGRGAGRARARGGRGVARAVRGADVARGRVQQPVLQRGAPALPGGGARVRDGGRVSRRAALRGGRAADRAGGGG